mgnify:CR=1 FL=1
MTEVVKSSLPGWVLIVIYLLILAVLAIFGDLFIFILGGILETLVFAFGYDSNKEHH